MKKKLFWLCAALVVIIFNIACLMSRPDWSNEMLTLSVRMKADTTENTQVYYLLRGESLKDIRYNAKIPLG